MWKVARFEVWLYAKTVCMHPPIVKLVCRVLTLIFTYKRFSRPFRTKRAKGLPAVGGSLPLLFSERIVVRVHRPSAVFFRCSCWCPAVGLGFVSNTKTLAVKRLGVLSFWFDLAVFLGCLRTRFGFFFVYWVWSKFHTTKEYLERSCCTF